MISDDRGGPARPGEGAPSASPRRPRCFELVEYVEHPGVSGHRVIAEGVQFSTGTVAVHWTYGPRPVTAVWPGLDSMLAFPGHSAATVLRWLDLEPPPQAQPDSTTGSTGGTGGTGLHDAAALLETSPHAPLGTSLGTLRHAHDDPTISLPGPAPDPRPEPPTDQHRNPRPPAEPSTPPANGDPAPRNPFSCVAPVPPTRRQPHRGDHAISATATTASIGSVMTTGETTIPASKVRPGDRLLLDGYTREVVRVQTVGAASEIRVRISFLNGAGTTVASTHTFEIADVASQPDDQSDDRRGP